MPRGPFRPCRSAAGGAAHVLDDALDARLAVDGGGAYVDKRTEMGQRPLQAARAARSSPRGLG